MAPLVGTTPIPLPGIQFPSPNIPDHILFQDEETYEATETLMQLMQQDYDQSDINDTCLSLFII